MKIQAHTGSCQFRTRSQGFGKHIPSIDLLLCAFIEMQAVTLFLDPKRTKGHAFDLFDCQIHIGSPINVRILRQTA